MFKCIYCIRAIKTLRIVIAYYEKSLSGDQIWLYFLYLIFLCSILLCGDSEGLFCLRTKLQYYTYNRMTESRTVTKKAILSERFYTRKYYHLRWLIISKEQERNALTSVCDWYHAMDFGLLKKNINSISVFGCTNLEYFNRRSHDQLQEIHK